MGQIQEKLLDALKDGEWTTIADLKRRIGEEKRSNASISSALRKLRDEAHGGHEIESKGSGNRFIYRLVTAEPQCLNGPFLDGNTLLDIMEARGFGFTAMARFLEEKGIVNPATRRPFTRSGVKASVKRTERWKARREAHEKQRQEIGAKLKQLSKRAKRARARAKK